MGWFRRLVWRFIYSFTTNNNTRLFTLWAVTAIWFFAHAFIFGFGPKPSTEISEVAQRFNNAYRFNRWATDAELAGLSGVVGGIWEALIDKAHWVSGKVLLGLILMGVVYPFVAMSDEARRAWQIALRKVRERRARFTDLPEPPAPAGAAPAGVPAPRAERPLTLKQWLPLELLAGFVNEFWQLIAHRMIGV